MSNAFQPYQTLTKLLQSQARALEVKDTQRLEAIRPLIEKYSGRIGEQESELQHLTSDEKVVLRRLLTDIQQQITSNQEGWKHYRGELAKARSQLRETRRFAQQVSSISSPRRPRFQQTG